MALWAIADLHLAHQVEKPMHVFGSRWSDHERRIEENWKASVRSDDTVLIPGDVSWAMTLNEAVDDMIWLMRYPVRKFCCAAITITGGRVSLSLTPSVQNTICILSPFAQQCFSCRYRLRR